MLNLYKPMQICNDFLIYWYVDFLIGMLGCMCAGCLIAKISIPARSATIPSQMHGSSQITVLKRQVTGVAVLIVIGPAIQHRITYLPHETVKNMKIVSAFQNAGRSKLC